MLQEYTLPNQIINEKLIEFIQLNPLSANEWLTRVCFWTHTLLWQVVVSWQDFILVSAESASRFLQTVALILDRW